MYNALDKYLEDKSVQQELKVPEWFSGNLR